MSTCNEKEIKEEKKIEEINALRNIVSFEMRRKQV